MLLLSFSLSPYVLLIVHCPQSYSLCQHKPAIFLFYGNTINARAFFLEIFFPTTSISLKFLNDFPCHMLYIECLHIYIKKNYLVKSKTQYFVYNFKINTTH